MLPLIFFLLTHRPNRGGRRWGRPWAGGPRGAMETGKWGKTERRPRGSDSPTHLEQRRSVKGCPRRRAEVGDNGYGGGTARLGRGRAVGRVVVVAEGCAEALFTGWERRWRGGAPVAELGGH